MSNIALGRVQREMKEILNGDEAKNDIIIIKLLDSSNFTRLKGEIKGPPETPYEGGKFELDIKIPETYPFNPPEVKFLTKIWHPNISSVTGAICLDILKDQWAAAMTLRTVLLSIQALLTSAEPDDPQDAVVASQYKDDHETFLRTARYWTKVHAGASTAQPELESKMKKLMDMGFKEEKARTALSTCGWNIERAIEQLTNL